jgi:hypothetical protein
VTKSGGFRAGIAEIVRTTDNCRIACWFRDSGHLRFFRDFIALDAVKRIQECTCRVYLSVDALKPQIHGATARREAAELTVAVIGGTREAIESLDVPPSLNVL